MQNYKKIIQDPVMSRVTAGKKTLFFFFVLFLPTLHSSAQVNTYFQNDPVWQENSACAFNFPCIDNRTFNYYVNGDSVINSITYKKIFKKGTGYYMWQSQSQPDPSCTGTYIFIDTVPSYYMRSLGKKMFVRAPNDVNEYLLYDFALSLGDSLPLTYNNYDNAVVVTAIDSFNTPNGYMKRFTLNGNTWAQYLIEGVGHSRGLVEPMQIPLECGFFLNCFSLNDTAYFPAIGPTCDLMVGENMIQRSAVQLSVFPNPVSDLLNISAGEIKIVKCFIYDPLGRLVLTASNSKVIDVSRLSKGMYILKTDLSEGPSQRMTFIKE